MKYLLKIKSALQKNIFIIFLTGILLGVFLFIAVRFIFNNPASTHFHANFAVLVDGNREEFEGPGYYEEVQACSATESPKGRTHMHLPDSNLVHVHDKNVTWGHFFESIGWSMGPDVLASPARVYTSTNEKKLTFVLNGTEVKSPYNQVIVSQDVLLITFSNTTINVTKESDLAKLPTSAQKANKEKDPTACRGSEELGFGARFKKAIW